jgi:hypothetical protein
MENLTAEQLICLKSILEGHVETDADVEDGDLHYDRKVLKELIEKLK